MENEEMVEQTASESVEVDDTSVHQEVESNEELEKARKLAENQKIRAEKAEKELKKLKALKDEKPEVSSLSSFSLADIRALNNVHESLIEVVEKFARNEGVSIAEAVKNKDLQAIIRSRTEELEAAEAANTGKVPRGAGKLADEQILAEAYSGKVVDPKELAAARFNSRIKSIQKR